MQKREGEREGPVPGSDSENQRRNRRHRVLIGAAVLALATTAIVVWRVLADKPIVVVPSALTTEQSQMLADYLEANLSDVPFAFPSEESTQTPNQLVIDLAGNELVDPSAAQSRILAVPESPIPISIVSPLMADGGVAAYPVALDHVEVAYRRDLFAETLLTSDGRLRDLSALERGLETLVGSVTRYPFVAAGTDNQTLIDLVSVLALSTGGSQRYRSLLESAGEDPASLMVQDLGAGWTLQTVVDRLIDWKSRGLTHPEWEALSQTDVLQLAQRQLTGAVVMRLSTHRTWPVQTLNRIRTSPFPFADAQDAGQALVAPLMVARYNGPPRRIAEAQQIAKVLVSRTFQDEVVRDWRLAPVHSTATPLDRESRDLRFWAAASRLVLPSLSDVLDPDQRRTLAGFIRSRL